MERLSDLRFVAKLLRLINGAGIEQVIAFPEVAATLDEFQGPQPAEVEAAALRAAPARVAYGSASITILGCVQVARYKPEVLVRFTLGLAISVVRCQALPLLLIYLTDLPGAVEALLRCLVGRNIRHREPLPAEDSAYRCRAWQGAEKPNWS
jgi:hypothetical protein